MSAHSKTMDPPVPAPGFALFSLPGWRREKLSILRWTMHDRARATPAVEAMLERALADRDWELRVTAMLAAARLRATTLAAPIARLTLPSSPREGVTDLEHRVLLALRDATLERLGHARGRKLPPGITEALAGDLTALSPGIAAFVTALTEPLPDEVPAPPPSTGISTTSQGLVLADGHLLVWVPPVSHWLGDDGLRNALANPVRRIQPQQGFYIDAEQRGIASYADAETAAADLASRLGRPVRLPSDDEWEMAARGPDGRRFPWGMNADRSVRVDLSPWDMTGIVQGPGEWLRSAGGQGVVAGGRRFPIPAHHRRADPGEIHGYRFMYEPTPADSYSR